MDRTRRTGSGRRSSGLLVNASAAQGGEAQVLCEALRKLTAVTRAISANLHNVNDNLERILMDKEDIDELEKMLENRDELLQMMGTILLEFPKSSVKYVLQPLTCVTQDDLDA